MYTHMARIRYARVGADLRLSYSKERLEEVGITDLQDYLEELMVEDESLYFIDFTHCGLVYHLSYDRERRRFRWSARTNTNPMLLA